MLALRHTPSCERRFVVGTPRRSCRGHQWAEAVEQQQNRQALCATPQRVHHRVRCEHNYGEGNTPSSPLSRCWPCAIGVAAFPKGSRTTIAPRHGLHELRSAGLVWVISKALSNESRPLGLYCPLVPFARASAIPPLRVGFSEVEGGDAQLLAEHVVEVEVWGMTRSLNAGGPMRPSHH